MYTLCYLKGIKEVKERYKGMKGPQGLIWAHKGHIGMHRSTLKNSSIRPCWIRDGAPRWLLPISYPTRANGIIQEPMSFIKFSTFGVEETHKNDRKVT